MASQDSDTTVTSRPVVALTLDSQLFQAVPENYAWNHTFISKITQPDTIFSLAYTGQSMVDGFINHNVAGRIGNTALHLLTALAGSYPTHESGHWYRLLNGLWGSPPTEVEDLLRSIGGLNTTQDFAQRYVLAPYLGLASDWAYLVNKADTSFYSIQEALAKATWNPKGTDLSRYLEFRYKKDGTSDTGLERSYLAALQVWNLLDLYKPTARILRDMVNGVRPTNPYAPGEWTLKTEGYLSSGGPLFGAKALYFVEGHSSRPSALTLEGWVAPLKSPEMNDYPFGFGVELTRIPLPVKFGNVRPSVSATFGASFQAPNPWQIVDEATAKTATPQASTILLEGGGGVHFETDRVEMALKFHCRQDRILWRENFDSQCSVSVGMEILLGR